MLAEAAQYLVSKKEFMVMCEAHAYWTSLRWDAMNGPLTSD
jgi:hypothetical protein